MVKILRYKYESKQRRAGSAQNSVHIIQNCNVMPNI